MRTDRYMFDDEIVKTGQMSRYMFDDAELEHVLKFNENHEPTGSPEGGQFASEGVSLESVDDESTIQQYLRMVSKLHGDHPSVDKFILEYGQEFETFADTYKGKRGRIHGCYENATKAALDGRGTYVEGYTTVHGIPIAHAWIADDQGRVIDPTVKAIKNYKMQYFGVPYETEYLLKRTLKTKYYGLHGHLSVDQKLIAGGSTENVIASDFAKVKKFNPHHVPAGDERGGQFTTAADAGAGGAAEKLMEERNDKDVTLEQITASLKPEEQALMLEAERQLAQGVPTVSDVVDGGFKRADGTYTIERQALHERIISEYFTNEKIANATPAEGEKPKLIMTGGRPAAGKTSSLRVGRVEYDPDRYIVVNADTIQEKLPGYSGLRAGLYNQEGQDIAAQVERVARSAKLNMVYDATMKTKASAMKRVTGFQKDGYEVDVYFVHTTPAVSARRSVQRALTSGRYIPPSVSFNSLTNESSFEAVSRMADKWILFDNNGAVARVVASGGKN